MHSHMLQSTKSHDWLIFQYKYQPCFSHFSIQIIMRSLSPTLTQHILHLLDSGKSAHQICDSTGVHTSTICRLRSKHHSSLQKSSGGCPSLLSPVNIHHGVHLITSLKAENAVQVSKTLGSIINQPISAKTVCCHLSSVGMKAVVKKKCPTLKPHHW